MPIYAQSHQRPLSPPQPSSQSRSLQPVWRAVSTESVQGTETVMFRGAITWVHFVLTVNAPVTLTEPTAAAETPATETHEPQPEVVAESGKTVVEPRLERGKHKHDVFFSLYCSVNNKHLCFGLFPHYSFSPSVFIF